MYADNIAAISTPLGEGGIAIVRTSGNEVIGIVDKTFRPYQKESRLINKPGYTLSLGWLLDDDGREIDEVLISVMRKPKSFTGEDVIEINCHGGILPARKCLERLLKMGMRLAEPGEFTRRAYLNGRLDISQAEAIIEIIRARSDKSLKLAMEQLAGKNRQQMEVIEERLIGINAEIEASLDFPDEVGEPDYNKLEQELEDIYNQIEQILKAAERADIYRDGINIAISGKPNVGKSSLLNALLRKERAIVTDIPGTTRDLIEDYLNVKDIPVKLIDTAGIRATEDLVESIGVERSQSAIEKADLVVFLLDEGTGLTKDDLNIYKKLQDKKVIVLVNKEDLEQKHIDYDELSSIFKGDKIIRASIKNNTGLDELEETIENMVLQGKVEHSDREIMLNVRQKNILNKALQHIRDAVNSIENVPLDCLDVDIWGALEALGEVSGKNLKDEILDRIFKDFCIGK